jgi:hypothetical protein
MANYEHFGKGVNTPEPPNYRNQENCGRCNNSTKYSNFQDAYCKLHKKNVKITKVCDDFE